MTTSKIIFDILHMCGLVINIKDICVFIGPAFSGLTAIASYLFAKEVSGSSGAGLFAALFTGISPAYLSRSVAGSYDNEAVAIFAMVFAFYCWIYAVNHGTMIHAAMASLATFYMVTCWGAYVFIINTVAIYIIALTIFGRLKSRHIVVYLVYYVITTILCLNVPFVTFATVLSSEHMPSHGVFLLLTAIWLKRYLEEMVSKGAVRNLAKAIVSLAALSFVVIFVWLNITGRTSYSPRSMTMLDPTYAAKYIPIVASVSEHQPTTWGAYVFDLHFPLIMAPVGLYICFRNASDGMLFAGTYALLAVYFSGVMARLMLILSPAMCVLAGIGVSYFVSSFVSYIRVPTAIERASQPKVTVGTADPWLPNECKLRRTSG
eukprot:GHVT01080575.1.p1 GENE.GHVT01080575.1~~GHVT01080575.1.p1  ORF type:complete len:376 (-),score=17.97 GHVT01080575.1:525-1652(-)